MFQMYSRGIFDYLSCGWNWIDIGMDILMVFSYTIWIVFYFVDNRDDFRTVIYFSDGMFSIGIILR